MSTMIPTPPPITIPPVPPGEPQPQGWKNCQSATLAANNLLPVVTTISPSVAPSAGGTAVTISGTYLINVSGVHFGSLPAISFVQNLDGSVTAIAPPGANGTSVCVVVTNPVGISGTVPIFFAYTDPIQPQAPVVTSISPAGGSVIGGTNVTITGSGFTGATGVRFGSAVATFSVLSDTSMSAWAPSAVTGPVDVTVTTPAGVSAISPADQFTYTAPVVIVIPPTTPIMMVPGSDVSKFMKTSTDKTYLTFPAGNYAVTGTPVVKANDLRMLFRPGVTMTITPAPPASPGATPPTTGIRVEGADLLVDMGGGSIFGGIPTTNVFRLFSQTARICDGKIDKCHNGILFDRLTKMVGGVLVDAGGSDSAYIHDLACGPSVGGQFILTMSDKGTFERIKLPFASLGEQDFRLDKSSTGHMPTGNRIFDCEFTGPPNALIKSRLDLRACNKTTVSKIICNGVMRVAELATATAPGQAVDDFILDNITFTYLEPTVVPNIDVKSGSRGVIQNCKLIGGQKPRSAVNIGTFCEVTWFNNPVTPGPGVTELHSTPWGGSGPIMASAAVAIAR